MMGTERIDWKARPLLLEATLWPKISVITPSYNQGQYIEETLLSVLGQQYPNLEYIVIDGGSDDETPEILKRYSSQLQHLLIEKDRGQSHALNKGFSRATGSILTWLNSDDCMAPDTLFSVALAFMTHDVDMIAGICEVREDNQPVHRHMTACFDGILPLDEILDLDKGWNGGQFFYQPEVFFSRDIWQAAGAYVSEDWHYSMDYELWCRFALNRARLHVIGRTLVHFRQHADQKTANVDAFKAELKHVRDKFIAQHNVKLRKLDRPDFEWGTRLKIGLINDNGFQYGAGIAHRSMAQSLVSAGHQICKLTLETYRTGEEDAIADRIARFVAAEKPDMLIVGNLHTKVRETLVGLDQFPSVLPVFLTLHDFWLFTGRCAYPEGCSKWQEGCNASCPTAEQYPELIPDKIAPAYAQKRAAIANDKGLQLLANSPWCASEAKAMAPDITSRVHTFQLGVPDAVFRPLDRGHCRKRFGIPEDNFVIFLHIDYEENWRKGSDYGLELLKRFDREGITFLFVGGQDFKPSVQHAQLLYFGVVDNIFMLACLLACVDIKAGPNRQETFGQMFAEAAMCGTPSIAFDATGMRASVKHGVTGLLVPDGDFEAFCKTVEDCKNDRYFTSELGERAALYARNEFSLAASYRSLFMVWRTLGLVPQFKLPHKIAFEISESLAPLKLRIGANGTFTISADADAIMRTSDDDPRVYPQVKRVAILMRETQQTYSVTDLWELLSRQKISSLDWILALMARNHPGIQLDRERNKWMLNVYADSIEALSRPDMLNRLSDFAVRHSCDAVIRCNDDTFAEVKKRIAGTAHIYCIPVSDKYGFVSFEEPGDVPRIFKHETTFSLVASNIKAGNCDDLMNILEGEH